MNGVGQRFQNTSSSRIMRKVRCAWIRKHTHPHPLRSPYSRTWSHTWVTHRWSSFGKPLRPSRMHTWINMHDRLDKHSHIQYTTTLGSNQRQNVIGITPIQNTSLGKYKIFTCVAVKPPMEGSDTWGIKNGRGSRHSWRNVASPRS